jgi:hypothetical protein
LLAENQTAQAFLVLQEALLKSPDDPLARYNYAIGAYAAGNYSTAIATFEKLATGPESGLAARSQLQLGNSFFRSGAAMQAENPEGTIEQWGKALVAFRQAPELPAAAHNLRKVRTDLLGLLGDVARRETAAGDAAARVSPERGVPTWRAALAHYDRALKIADREEEAQLLAEGRKKVADRIYDAFLVVGRGQQRRAELQKDSALERAIELMTEALGNFSEALAVRSGDPAAAAAKEQVATQLDPWRVELANRQHAQGVTARALSLEDAISFWQKAAGNYARVLEHAPLHAEALAGKQENDHTLHDAYVELGDQKQVRADEPNRPMPEKDALLEQALDHYQAALALEPANAATKTRAQQVGIKLTRVFVARGQQELAAGRALASTQPPEAIANVERAVQNFARALEFDAAHSAAKAGKAEAEELLKQLRANDAEAQRKMLGQGKELNAPKEMEDPGDLALKLIDYDNDHLASRKQQNFTAPENKPLKDW